MENKMRKMGSSGYGRASQAQIDAEWRAFWAQNERELARERAAKERLRRRLGVTKANEILAIHERWVVKGGRT